MTEQWEAKKWVTALYGPKTIAFAPAGQPARFMVTVPRGADVDKLFESDVAHLLMLLNDHVAEPLRVFIDATKNLEEFRPTDPRDLSIAEAAGVPVKAFWEAWDALVAAHGSAHRG